MFGENRSLREQLYWIDAHGNQAGEAMPPTERPTNFDLSHDERFIAVQQAGGIVIHDIARGVTTPLPVAGTDPIWSPDDRQILYAEPLSNAMRAIPASGGSPRLIYQSKAVPIYPEDWSTDGQWIAAVTRGQGVLIPTSRPDPQPISISVPDDLTQHEELRFSPDGHWLAFGQSRAGVNEAILTAVPPTGERWQLSFGGGAQPRWRSDGRALYFQSMTGTLMTVDVTLTPGKPPQISVPRRVFDTGIAPQPALDQYTPTRDRNRFLMRRPLEGAKPMPEQLQVIVSWPTLLIDGRAKAGSQ